MDFIYTEEQRMLADSLRRLVDQAWTRPQRRARETAGRLDPAAWAALAELGLPGFEMQSWQGIFAPAGTPAPIVERLAREIGAALQSPDVRAKLLTLGVAPDGRGPAPFAQFQRSEIDKWGAVVKSANLKAN